MIVTVALMRIMEVPLHEVIQMVAMRDWLVPAVRAMNVALLVASALMVRSAAERIIGADFYCVFLDAITLYIVQVTVV